MKRRIFSFIMAMLMVFTMMPVEAFSQATPKTEGTVYAIGDTQWVRGEDGEPEGETEEGSFWLPVYDEDDNPVTQQGFCGLTEHVHQYVCPEDCALAHTHGEACYRTEYVGCELHSHDETCATETVYDCGKAVHENHDSCTATEVCAVAEHDHAAMGCPTQINFTCEDAEHTHSVEAGCAYETVYTCGSENHSHADGTSCILSVS